MTTNRTESPALKLPSSRNRVIVAQAEKLITEGKTLLAAQQQELRHRNNDVPGLQGVLDGLTFMTGLGGVQDTASTPFTLANANSYVPVSLNRLLLSYTYMSQGLLRTAVDQVVEDAFRGGIHFKSGELDEDDVKELDRAYKRKRSRKQVRGTPMSKITNQSGYDMVNSDLEAARSVCKWGRLYGGSGLIVNTDQDFRQELNPDAIREDSPLSFIAADRWEIVLSNINVFDDLTPTPFNYYGLPLHRSRVITFMGDEAPSYIRLRLQGWGMSVFEQMMRPVSAFIKFERLLFELMDEAKIDVFGIQGYNTALATAAGAEKIMRRILQANQLKNFQTALTMDATDTYEQKTLSGIFPGLAEIWHQLRLNLCAYSKIPFNKLFGESAGGFGSGKDAMDNYNAVVGNLRETAEPIVLEQGMLRCQQLFGFMPEDLEVEWTPLSILDGVETETVKTSKQARIIAQFQAGLLDGQECCEALMKEGLLLVECEVLMGLRDAEPPLSQNPDEVEGQQKHDMDMQKTSAKQRQIGRKK